jgi:hypothetical protein
MPVVEELPCRRGDVVGVVLVVVVVAVEALLSSASIPRWLFTRRRDDGGGTPGAVAALRTMPGEAAEELELA